MLDHARKPTVLFDERIPFMFGNIAGILAGALSLLPAERLTEAVFVTRALEDRAQPDGAPVRHFLRIMVDRDQFASSQTWDGVSAWLESR